MPLAAWLGSGSHEGLFSGEEQMYYVCSCIRYSFFVLCDIEEMHSSATFVVGHNRRFNNMTRVCTCDTANILPATCDSFCASEVSSLTRYFLETHNNRYDTCPCQQHQVPLEDPGSGLGATGQGPQRMRFFFFWGGGYFGGSWGPNQQTTCA